MEETIRLQERTKFCGKSIEISFDQSLKLTMDGGKLTVTWKIET